MSYTIEKARELGLEVSPLGIEIIRLVVRLAQLQYRGAPEHEIAAAVDAFDDLPDAYDPVTFLHHPKRRGPGRPPDHRMEYVYHHARQLWMYVFGQGWTTSSSDRTNGPVFDGYNSRYSYGRKVAFPDNNAAKFLVAFARDVSPKITSANCHSVHDRIRREVFWPSVAQQRRRLKRRERQRALSRG